MGVGEMGQIIGETGVGEMGVIRQAIGWIKKLKSYFPFSASEPKKQCILPDYFIISDRRLICSVLIIGLPIRIKVCFVTIAKILLIISLNRDPR